MSSGYFWARTGLYVDTWALEHLKYVHLDRTGPQRTSAESSQEGGKKGKTLKEGVGRLSQSHRPWNTLH